MSDPLVHLLSEIQAYQSYQTDVESQTDAGIKLLRDVKAKLSDSPQLTKVDQLNHIAKPIAHIMKLLKATFFDKMEHYVPLKLSLMLTIIVCWKSTVTCVGHVLIPPLCDLSKIVTQVSHFTGWKDLTETSSIGSSLGQEGFSITGIEIRENYGSNPSRIGCRSATK